MAPAKAQTDTSACIEIGLNALIRAVASQAIAMLGDLFRTTSCQARAQLAWPRDPQQHLPTPRGNQLDRTTPSLSLVFDRSTSLPASDPSLERPLQSLFHAIVVPPRARSPFVCSGFVRCALFFFAELASTVCHCLPMRARRAVVHISGSSMPNVGIIVLRLGTALAKSAKACGASRGCGGAGASRR